MIQSIDTCPFESDYLFYQRSFHAKHSIQQNCRHHSAKDAKRPLSTEAIKCLTRYQQWDYELLRIKKTMLCKTDAYVAGIDSIAILKRRRGLLHDVVA